MRITALLVTSLLTVAAPAIGQTPYLDCMKGLPKETEKDKANINAIFAYNERFIAFVDKCQKNYINHQDTKEDYQPDHNYYEFKAWEANEDYKRDIEAINRDYDLRRTGVLP
jgi:hypothetical protein